MTQQEINQVYNRIIHSLDNKELKNAFDSLQSLISGEREYVFQDKLNEMQNIYKKLLHYRMNGVKDPMQDNIYRNIQTSAYELADRLKHSLLTATSTLYFYNLRRCMHVGEEIPTDKLCAKLFDYYTTGRSQMYEETLVFLFHKIWVSDLFTANDSAAVRKIWTNQNLPFTTGCQAVSALILALQACFDNEKLLLLFDAVHLSTCEEVRIRALIGILLTLYVYRKRTSLYPKITDRLETLAEEPGFCQTLRSITLRFILSRETEKITRRLQDEIIPEMMKLSPKINEKINPNDTNNELTDEKNPEWKDVFVDSALEKKIEEFNALQQEGADVMHFTFLHLKEFPFFREISNWFLPFTSEYSLFNTHFYHEGHEKNILDSISSASFLCNSDKYSIYFSMMQLPQEAQRMIAEQFNHQVDEIKEVRETIAGQYIQDLYRFFKLFPDKQDFDDIFIWPLDFHNLPILQPYISDQESLMTIAEYYLRKNYFDDALTIYSALAKTENENDMLFQKIGYCLQMQGDVQGALDVYLHANLLNRKSKWLIRRIAGCYRSLKQPDQALVYYRHYEELFPDKVSIYIGHCYLELKDYNEALKYYFKADYLDTKTHKAWRPIAWCSFLTGRYDQARNYYQKIIHEAIPNTLDYLNAGHTEWALQNNREAIEFYLQAIRKESGNISLFRKRFLPDIPCLLAAGISEEEISLMLDQLTYLIG
ncbi:MAG: tetratricopeptide repeat protein [Tannerellaceae bacterium]|jgi:tetratricopeptide (TPR) repeat protein|nr:tetratricopeptide repeat protein [Tannerellaceae bacterium]